MSLFNKAKDKIRRKDKDSDELSRSSSLRSRLSRSLKADKSKDKKRLSGLKYDTFSSSKESVISSASTVKDGKGKPASKVNATDVKDGAGPLVGKAEPKVNSTERVSQSKSIDSNEDTTELQAESKSEPKAGLIVDDLAKAKAKAPELLSARAISPGLDPLESAPIQVIRTSSTGDHHLKPNYNVGPHVQTEPEPVLVPNESLEINETTPLIRDLESQTAVPHPFSTTKFMLAVVTILLVSLGIVYFAYSGSNIVIQQSVHPQLNSVNILGFGDSGLDVHINSSIKINYDNITHQVFRQMYKLGGFVVGSVILKPQLPIKILINNMNSFDVTTPSEILLNVTNGSVNDIGFDLWVGLYDENIIQLLNDLMERDGVEINLKSHVVTDIQWGFITIPRVPISVNQNLTFNSELLKSPINTVDFHMNDDFQFNGEVNVPGILKEVINNSKFNLLIKNCEGKFHQIGEFLYNNDFINGSFLPFPKDNCNLISNIVDDYFHGISRIFINSTNSNKTYPKWLTNIINSVRFRVPMMNLSFSDVDYNISSLSIDDDDILSMVANISISSPIEYSNLRYSYVLSNGIVRAYGKGQGSLESGQLLNYLHLDKIEDILQLQHGPDKNGLVIEEMNIELMDIHSLIVNTSIVVNSSAIPMPPLSSSLEVFIRSLNLLEGLSFVGDVDTPFSHNLKHPLTLETEFGTISVAESVVTMDLQHNDALIEFLNGLISNTTDKLPVKLRAQDELAIFDGVNMAIKSQFTFAKPLITTPIIHILTSEIELTIFNPINHELPIEIQYVDAQYDGKTIGEISHQTVEIHGGQNRVKLPVKINQVGIDLLRKALNNDISVDVFLEFAVTVNQETLPLKYHGRDLNAGIRF